MIGAVVAIGASVLGSLSSRQSAKRQERAEHEVLKLNYNFQMNDGDREMLIQQEQLASEQFAQRLDRNSALADLAYNIGSRELESQSSHNMERMIRTQDFIAQMKVESNFDRTLEEYKRFQQNAKLNMMRGAQGSSNQVPSFFQSSMGGALQGISNVAPSLFSK